MTREPRSTIAHDEWMVLAAEEYRRIDRLLATLTPAQWDAPTDCTEWRVREIVAHLAGAAAATASIREQLRQQRLGRKHKGDRFQLDAVNDIHVRERAGLGPAELRWQLTEAAERGIRARTRMPAAIRALRFPFPPPVGWATLGYLNDIIYTRDAWMHRIDLCRATQTPYELTADHDGRIVTDVARAWQHATGHQRLILTGPAGSTFGGVDERDEVPTYDAIDFARALSGRGRLPGIQPNLVLF